MTRSKRPASLADRIAAAHATGKLRRVEADTAHDRVGRPEGTAGSRPETAPDPTFETPVDAAAVPQAAPSRSHGKPRKRQSTRKRPVGPADDDPPAPAAAAKQVPPSKPSPRSTVARNCSAIAWANDNPAEADRLLRPNAAAVLDLLAPDAEFDQAQGAGR